MIEALHIDPAARELLDAQALECAEAVIEHAEASAGKFGVQFQDACIRHWQSVEEPDVQEAVIDVCVDGTPSDVDAFWDALSEYLGRLIGQRPSVAGDQLSVRVRYR